MTAVCSTATHQRLKNLLGGSVLMCPKVEFMDIVLLWGRKSILGHRESGGGVVGLGIAVLLTTGLFAGFA
jgi:hypothetical protein